MEIHKYEPLRHIVVPAEAKPNEVRELILKLKNNSNSYNHHYGNQPMPDFVKSFKESKQVIQLKDSMQEFVYPRIKQLMTDFGIITSDIALSLVVRSFKIVLKDQYLHIVFDNNNNYNPTSIIIKEKCPFYEAPNYLQTYSSDNTYVGRYIEYCNCIMTLLEKLALYDIAIKQTIERAEKCVFRTEKKVLIEKIVKRN